MLPFISFFFLIFVFKFNNKYHRACIKAQSNPTKNDADVKYIPPFGAEPDNSADCVANITTPVSVTSNSFKLADVSKNDAVPGCTDAVINPDAIYDPALVGPLLPVNANDAVML